MQHNGYKLHLYEMEKILKGQTTKIDARERKNLILKLILYQLKTLSSG